VAAKGSNFKWDFVSNKINVIREVRELKTQLSYRMDTLLLSNITPWNRIISILFSVTAQTKEPTISQRLYK
jgi:hypothetical protein